MDETKSMSDRERCCCMAIMLGKAYGAIKSIPKYYSTDNWQQLQELIKSLEEDMGKMFYPTPSERPSQPSP